MSNHIEAAQNARNLASKFKSLFDLADYLDGVGSLDQLESEVNARIAAAKLEEQKQLDLAGKATEKVAAAQSNLDEITKQYDDMMKLAQTKGADIVAAAQLEAAKLLDDAKGLVQIASDGAADADARLLKTLELIADADQELARVNTQIETAKAAALQAFAPAAGESK